MKEECLYTIINQQNGNLAFKLFSFTDNSHFDTYQQNNFYTLIWIKNGAGLLKVDFSEYLFTENTFFAFAPYQPFMFSTDQKISGFAIQFHADFYCIHRNPHETNCDQILFNNIYQEPFLKINQEAEEKLTLQIEQLIGELQEKGNYELIVPILKIIIVMATRLKANTRNTEPKFIASETPLLLSQLKNKIEENYNTKHSANEYASLLNISSNALAKLVKSHFNKTLTELITERIIIQAKRELYMTNKPIKEIAWQLGYKDEFYFSRLFKNQTTIAPQTYRENVGFGRAEIA